MSVHHRHGGPSHNKLEITFDTPIDNWFSSPKQIRWSVALGKLLVSNAVYSHVRNSDLSFNTKHLTNRYTTCVDSDTTNLFGGVSTGIYLYKMALSDPINYVSVATIGASVRMIDASGDPLHVYVTSNNAADGHGVRMVTKSTMAVTGGGTPVQILATGTGDNQFTNPLGLLYIATNADSGFLYVCEATRICKIAVVTTAGSESFTWTTSYAIAANDLAWDGTNFYVQSSTQTIKYDNVFTDATKVATACVGYSITYIPDQGDGYGATLAIVDSTNSHLERRKCSDLSAINSVGSAGDGSSSLFDPTFTTSVATQIEYKFDDGFSYVTPSGTSHALSWNGFAGYSFRTAGPHKCTISVRGRLGLVTGIDARSDAITLYKNLQKLSSPFGLVNSGNYKVPLNMLSPCIDLRGDCSGNLSSIPNVKYFDLSGSDITGDISNISRSATVIYIITSSISGSLSNLPSTPIYVYLYSSNGITPGSIAHLVAIRDLRIYSMGWHTDDVDLVLKSISDAIHADVNHFTFATPALQIGVTNQAPSHLDGYFDPMVVLGAGVGDADHWDWDAVLGKHKAKSGGSAIWVMTHNVGHVWSVTCTGGGPYP